MPTYDYHCTACDTDHEIFHGMSEPAKKKCPRCGKNKLERRIGAGAGFLFKGSGFYLTDYRSESYKEGAKKDDAGASSPSSASPSNAASPLLDVLRERRAEGGLEGERAFEAREEVRRQVEALTVRDRATRS